MSKEIHIMVGIPASGKSTWVKEQCEKRKKIHNGFLVISRDQVRYNMLAANDEYFSKEKEVFAEFTDLIKIAALSRSYQNIYVDATHINAKSRAKLIRAIAGIGYEGYDLVFECFQTPLVTCLKRNAQREGRERVPDSVIEKMFNDLTFPSDSECGIYQNILHFDHYRMEVHK